MQRVRGLRNTNLLLSWCPGLLLQFLTCISSSYIFMLRSLFVLDLRPRYTREQCYAHQKAQGKLVSWIWCREFCVCVCLCVCVLTPLLSIVCRTPCRELRDDCPGHVCLYSSSVARASSRLTSTSNTIPFSSTHTENKHNYRYLIHAPHYSSTQERQVHINPIRI